MVKGSRNYTASIRLLLKRHHLATSEDDGFNLIIKVYLVSGWIVLDIDAHTQENVSIDFLIDTGKQYIMWFFMTLKYHF